MTPAPDNVRPIESPWWLTPHGLTLGFLLPVLVLVAAAGRMNFPGLTVRGHIFLNDGYVLMAMLILVCIALAGWVGTKITPSPHAPDKLHYLRAGLVVGVVALLAYLYWFKSFFLNPVLLLQTLTGAYRPDRAEIGSTTGITSLVNMAPVFFSIYAFCWVHADKPMTRSCHLLAAVLMALTLFRVYAWSERLALIEATIPFAVAIGFKLAKAKPSSARRLALLVGPFALVPLLILYFGASEYFRSWQSDTYAGKMSFWEFAIGRFASYYYTSLNNGAGVLSTFEWPSLRFENTLMWVHKFPLGVGEAFGVLVGQPRTEFNHFSQFLARYVDQEFNNPSGVFSVVYDLGLPVGIVYFCAIALAAGYALNLYRQAHPAGALIYPLLYLSFLEIFRYPYLGASRAFTWQIGIALVFVLAAFVQQLGRSK
jgi:hypothetical protein